MVKGYIPEFSKKELKIWFEDEVPSDMGEYIANKFGYTLKLSCIESEEMCDLIDIGEDNIENAIIKIKEKYGEMIKGIEPRDLKFERRSKLKDILDESVQDIDECASDKDFKNYLEEIKRYISGYED